MDFEWDTTKAAGNRSKHGVSFDEASDVFGDAPIIGFDDGHSTDEERFIAVGVSTKNRVLVVSDTYRDGRVRIISARAATKKEQQSYGEDQT
jgi:uncharacterized DUF497 family protein